MADLQVNKQRGCSGGGADDDMIRDRSHFKSFGFFYAICTDGQPTPQKITSHACLNTAVWTASERLTKKLHTLMDTTLKFQIHAAISPPRVCHIHSSVNQDISLTELFFIQFNICFNPLFSYFQLLFLQRSCEKKNPFCLWSKFAWIPDNAADVTWQFPCLNLMWCQAGWNRSILGNTEPFMKVSPFHCLTPKTHVKQACCKMQI